MRPRSEEGVWWTTSVQKGASPHDRAKPHAKSVDDILSYREDALLSAINEARAAHDRSPLELVAEDTESMRALFVLWLEAAIEMEVRERNALRFFIAAGWNVPGMVTRSQVFSHVTERNVSATEFMEGMFEEDGRQLLLDNAITHLSIGMVETEHARGVLITAYDTHQPGDTTRLFEEWTELLQTQRRANHVHSLGPASNRAAREVTRAAEAVTLGGSIHRARESMRRRFKAASPGPYWSGYVVGATAAELQTEWLVSNDESELAAAAIGILQHESGEYATYVLYYIAY